MSISWSLAVFFAMGFGGSCHSTWLCYWGSLDEDIFFRFRCWIKAGIWCNISNIQFDRNPKLGNLEENPENEKCIFDWKRTLRQGFESWSFSLKDRYPTYWAMWLLSFFFIKYEFDRVKNEHTQTEIRTPNLLLLTCRYSSNWAIWVFFFFPVQHWKHYLVWKNCMLGSGECCNLALLQLLFNLKGPDWMRKPVSTVESESYCNSLYLIQCFSFTFPVLYLLNSGWWIMDQFYWSLPHLSSGGLEQELSADNLEKLGFESRQKSTWLHRVHYLHEQNLSTCTYLCARICRFVIHTHDDNLTINFMECSIHQVYN